MATRAQREREFVAAFAEVLRELRHERGLSQDELADACHLHVNHVSFLERGLRIPSLLVVFNLADGLRVPPAELVTRVARRLSHQADRPEP